MKTTEPLPPPRPQWQPPVLSESQQRLEDKLLLIQSRSLLDQIDAVKKHPENIDKQAMFEQKIRSLKQQLKQKQSALLNCSSRYKTSDLKLALECTTLANRVSPTRTGDNALIQIEQSLEAKAKKKEVSKTAKLKRKRDSLMVLAKKQKQQPDYSATIKTLNQVLKIAPNDKEAKQLLQELESIQEKHVVELIAMGDRLYRDENIEQALALWKAAKNLSENNEELLGKINRAEKVLGTFNKIKGLPAQPED